MKKDSFVINLKEKNKDSKRVELSKMRGVFVHKNKKYLIDRKKKYKASY